METPLVRISNDLEFLLAFLDIPLPTSLREITTNDLKHPLTLVGRTVVPTNLNSLVGDTGSGGVELKRYMLDLEGVELCVSRRTDYMNLSARTKHGLLYFKPSWLRLKETVPLTQEYIINHLKPKPNTPMKPVFEIPASVNSAEEANELLRRFVREAKKASETHLGRALDPWKAAGQQVIEVIVPYVGQ